MSYGYEMWLQTRENKVFRNLDHVVSLTVSHEVERVKLPPISPDTIMFIDYPLQKVIVTVHKRETEYCGDMECLSSKDFGEYSPEVYEEATKHFNELVMQYM